MDRFVATATFFTTLGVILLAGNIAVAEAILYDKDGIPVELSGDEYVVLRDVALSDYRVKTLIDGRNYSITDYGFSKPNLELGWYPVIHLTVDNEMQIAAAVDLEQRRVVDVTTGPVVQFQPARESQEEPTTTSLFLMIGMGAAIAGVFAFFSLRRFRKAG